MNQQIRAMLTIADHYLKIVGIAEATLSKRLLGDFRSLTMIREGRDVGVIRRDEIVQWFSDNWPDGHEWPYEIARPTPRRETDHAKRQASSGPKRAQSRRRKPARKGD